MPVLGVTLDPTALAAVGLKGQDVLNTIATDYAGTNVGEAYSGPRTVDVIVQLPDRWRRMPEQLGALTVTGPLGLVPISSVARIVPTSGRYRIEHENGERFVAVTFNVSGRSLQSVVGDIQDRLAKGVAAGVGTRIEIAGAAAAEQHTRSQIGAYSMLALVAVILILFATFHWHANPWLVVANIPFSLIGGIAAISASGIGLSLGALVGLVTVFGISARNAILLLSYYEVIVDTDDLPWTEDVVIRGANERLTPILMTAILTALGLAPLAFSMAQPGLEISGPMAITILGGLASSTLLNLFLLPALAARFAGPVEPVH
jgi:Cu/Ag efflux pump CusA